MGMHTWLHAVLSTILRRHRDEAGQVEAIIIALVIFLLILILSGRRVLVQ